MTFYTADNLGDCKASKAEMKRPHGPTRRLLSTRDVDRSKVIQAATVSMPT